MLDSSDVVVHVLDARDPMGTMCKPVLDFLKKEKAHKGVVFVLNKVDLVPTWVTVSTSSASFRSLSPSLSFLFLVPSPFFLLRFLPHAQVKFFSTSSCSLARGIGRLPYASKICYGRGRANPCSYLVSFWIPARPFRLAPSWSWRTQKPGHRLGGWVRGSRSGCDRP